MIMARFNNVQVECNHLTVGISTAAVMTYLDLYHEYAPKPEFARRWAEIDLVGATHFAATDAKKGASSPSRKSRNAGRKP
jgi:hypothetical protein